mmetsp:Transcript_99859/g.286874  ORF Transcript_99859/g.286874 Transcript_99859/m.286874 type:complete len:255 (+) Transcript_99859:89-853(+)
MRILRTAATAAIFPFFSTPFAAASRPPKARRQQLEVASAAAEVEALALGGDASAGSSSSPADAAAAPALIAMGASRGLDPARASKLAAGPDDVDENDPAVRKTAEVVKQVEAQLDKALDDFHHEELSSQDKQKLLSHVESKMMGVGGVDAMRSANSTFDTLMHNVNDQIQALGRNMTAAHQGLEAWHDAAVKLADGHKEMQRTGAEVTALSRKANDGVDEAHRAVAAVADEARQVVDDAARHIVADGDLAAVAA